VCVVKGVLQTVLHDYVSSASMHCLLCVQECSHIICTYLTCVLLSVVMEIVCWSYMYSMLKFIISIRTVSVLKIFVI